MTNFLHLSLSLTFLFLTGIATNLTAQTNLLTNPSFENYSNCPTGLSQSGYLSDWSIGTASPEYYNCSYNGNGIITGASSNGTGSLGIWGGPNHPSCVGEAYSESMTGALGTAMENGKTYEVKFDLQLDGSGSATAGANNCIDFGFYFFDQTTPPNLAGLCCKPVTPQAAVNGGSVAPGVYQTFQVIFTANGDYDRVLVGTYCNGNTAGSACSDYYGTRMYFNLDNVSVVEVVQLPVEISEFSGKALPGRNELKWQTVSEIQNDRFEVEKCTGDCQNSQNFAKIGSIKGMGSDRIGQAYTFEDELPTIGANYYRLKQIDVNGAFSYSHTIEVNYRENLNTAEVFPNPFGSKTTFRLSVEATAVVELEVTDASGRVIKKENRTLRAGTHEIPVDLSNQAEGIYFLKAWSEVEGNESMLNTFKLVRR